MTALLSLGLGIALAWLAGALGAFLLRSLRLAPSSRAEHAPLALAIGLGVLGESILVLGLAGLLSAGPVLLLLAALALVAWRDLSVPLGWIRGLISRFGAGSPGAATARAALLGVSFAGLIATLAPPTGSDTLKYHLAAPALWLAEGAIRFHPYLHFNQPMALEAGGAVGLRFGGETAQLVLHLVAGFAAAAALWSVAVAAGAERAAPLATLIFFASPLTLSEAIGHCQDFGVVLGGLAGLVAFLRWKEGAPDAWLLAAGAAAGLGAASKYTGLYAVAALMALIAVATARGRRGVRPAVLFSLGVLLIAGPWYLKNWIQSGNPVWPAFYTWFGGTGWNEAAHTVIGMEVAASYRALGSGAWAFFAGPAILAAVPQLVFENSGGVGVAAGVLAPLAAALRGGWGRRGWLVAFAGLVYAAWFPFSHNGRFLWPAWAVVGIVAAEGAVACWRWPAVRWIVRATVTFHLCLAAVLCYTVLERSLVPLVGIFDRAEYLRRAVPRYDAIRWLNENAPADALVAATPEGLYHLDRRYVWVGLHSGVLDRNRMGGWIDYLAQVRALGATHLFLEGVEVPPGDLPSAGAREVYRSPVADPHTLFWTSFQPSFVYSLGPAP